MSQGGPIADHGNIRLPTIRAVVIGHETDERDAKTTTNVSVHISARDVHQACLILSGIVKALETKYGSDFDEAVARLGNDDHTVHTLHETH